MVISRRSTNDSSSGNRRMRGFKRWMKSEVIECSDALIFSISSEYGDSMDISVKTLCDLREGDIVATIPKRSCLTVMTSAASRLIQEAQLGGYLGLAVALMYEKSLGPQSKWFQYLQLLPPSEPIPLLWSLDEIDSLLAGTELHKIIKEDKALVYQDWKECIEPLLTGSTSIEVNPDFFTVDEYLAAKSLIASRSFEIDEYHGSGMVPLADLFNHKTAAEDVHFTAVSPSSESDVDTESINQNFDDQNKEDDEPIASDSHSEFDGSNLELSSVSNDLTTMEMIIVKDVKAGDEVFNTYGSLGNAALLHRYGFTEPDNPFDVLNIDLEIVIQWSLTLFSCRYSRRRLAFWRKMDYSGCVSENSEYFEVSFDGEPQAELLALLNVMLLSDEGYNALERASVSWTKVNKLGKEKYLCVKGSEMNKESLLRPGSVREALLSIADAREGMYGKNTLQDDMRLFKESCRETDGKLYHSLLLRISERRIIEKLRSFATCGDGISETAYGTRTRKRLKQD